QVPEHGAPLGRLPRLPRHPERRQRRVLERLARRQPEELGLARVRPGPAALHERDAELVELVEDPEPVLDRVREAGPLRAVAQGGVVQLDVEWLAHAETPSTTRSPTSRVEKPIAPARIECSFEHANRMPAGTAAPASLSPSCPGTRRN